MKIVFKSIGLFLFVIITVSLKSFTIINESLYDIHVSIFEDNDFLRYRKWIYPERFEIRWIDDFKSSRVNNVERGHYSITLKHGQIAEIDMSADIDYCHVHLLASRMRNGQTVKNEEWWSAEAYYVLPDHVIRLCPRVKKIYEILQ